MADYYLGLDSAATITNPRALTFFDFALRYLKWTDTSEITGLLGAGIAVGLIWEHGTDDALGGAVAGSEAAQQAVAKARALGAPEGAGIFVAVDMDTAALTEAQFATACAYCDAFVADVVEAGFTGGIYACGDVLTATIDCVPWLAGAMGWAGSHAYDSAGSWVIKQGLPMDGGEWCGITWPSVGLQYDPNIATEIGWAWQPDDLPAVVDIPSCFDLQTALVVQGYDVGPSGCDGLWGKHTSDALGAYYADHSG